jgi:hypothetical protein
MLHAHSQDPHQPTVDLTKAEAAVMRCAISHYLSVDETETYLDVPDEDIEPVLADHLDSLTHSTAISVTPGMQRLYQTVFQEYAYTIQHEVETDVFVESNAKFMKSQFESIGEKLENVGGTVL